MEYTLDNYTKNADFLLERLAANCRRSRLDKGLSRKAVAEQTGVPAPTIEHFERTGKISLEAFCKIAIAFDYYDELGAVMARTKYSTSRELEIINKNRNRKRGSK